MPDFSVGQLETSDVPLQIEEAQLALDVLMRFAAEPQSREKASSLVALGVAISAVAGERACSDAEVAFALHRAIEAYRVGGPVRPVGAPPVPPLARDDDLTPRGRSDV